jgi:hypothetical protein
MEDHTRRLVSVEKKSREQAEQDEMIKERRIYDRS